jgi:hypothetical protein
VPENAFQYFLGRQNARIVQLLERNPDIAGTIQALLEHLVIYCDEEGVDFEHVRLIEPHISPDGRYMKAHITRVY